MVDDSSSDYENVMVDEVGWLPLFFPAVVPYSSSERGRNVVGVVQQTCELRMVVFCLRDSILSTEVQWKRTVGPFGSDPSSCRMHTIRDPYHFRH